MTSAVQAIILAGGLGTRLRSVVNELPKCMAPVNGKPFLAYVIKHLHDQGITDFIFSVGYMHEPIVNYIQKEVTGISCQISMEEEPLGTGGAIRLACEKTNLKTAVVCNGDTLFKADINKVVGFHDKWEAHCTLALKRMQKFDRYGVVDLNPDHSIKSFKEKQWYDEGLINGGVYALHAGKFLDEDLPKKFSFEKDYLEKYYDKRRMYGVVQNEYFIDIGIPEDYKRAQRELAGNIF